MRWQALFDDLEAQLEAADRADLEAEVRDRTRAEVAQVQTADRLRAARGGAVTLSVHGVGAVAGRVLDAGPDWLLLQEPPGRELLVPASALLAVAGLTRRVAPPQDRVGRRLDLRWALRGLARDRAPVTAVLRDGTVLAGTLDRVGADHVDLAEHPSGEARRAGAVTGVRLLPLTGLALVRQG